MELYHYGVKGMKWGVRRYQNPDGSLTPAGKKRLAKSLADDYKGNHPSGKSYPGEASAEFKETVKDASTKVLTSEDRSRLKKAWAKHESDEEKAEAANDALYAKVQEYAKTTYKKNYERYKDKYSEDKISYLNDLEAEGIAWKNHPDLVRKYERAEEAMWNSYDAYKEECRTITSKLLGKYGDKPLYSYGSGTKSIRDEVSDVLTQVLKNDK